MQLELSGECFVLQQSVAIGRIGEQGQLNELLHQRFTFLGGEILGLLLNSRSSVVSKHGLRYHAAVDCRHGVNGAGRRGRRVVGSACDDESRLCDEANDGEFHVRIR
jgi:hypothetical protein